MGSRRVTRSSLLIGHKSPSNGGLNNKEDFSAKEYRKNKKRYQAQDSFEMASSAFSLSIPHSIVKPKHALHHSWTLWYSAANRKLSWKQNQIKIFSVTTVEDFWLMYNQVQPPSGLPVGHTYSLFRGEILPDREDVANRDGGKWMMICGKEERRESLDRRWLDIMFMAMEESELDYLVTGVEVCVRKKEDRLEVWIGDVDNIGRMVEVGRLVKRKLKVELSDQIEFSIHKDDKKGILDSRLAL